MSKPALCSLMPIFFIHFLVMTSLYTCVYTDPHKHRQTSILFHFLRIYTSLLPFLSDFSLSFSLTPPGFIRFSPRNTHEHWAKGTRTHTDTQRKAREEEMNWQRERERASKWTLLFFFCFFCHESSSIRRWQSLTWSNHFFLSAKKKSVVVRFN